MFLADSEIARRLSDDGDDLEIDPLDDPAVQIQPASVDLRLSDTIQIAYQTRTGDCYFDEVVADDTIEIHPGEFMLGSTIERVSVPDQLVGMVTGRSSVGRKGVFVHVSAGLCDPGWEGQVTLELYNASPAPVEFDVGQRVAQLMLIEVAGDVEDPYGERDDSRYQGQTGPTLSRLNENVQE